MSDERRDLSTIDRRREGGRRQTDCDRALLLELRAWVEAALRQQKLHTADLAARAVACLEGHLHAADARHDRAIKAAVSRQQRLTTAERSSVIHRMNLARLKKTSEAARQDACTPSSSSAS